MDGHEQATARMPKAPDCLRRPIAVLQGFQQGQIGVVEATRLLAAGSQAPLGEIGFFSGKRFVLSAHYITHLSIAWFEFIM